MSDSEDVRAAIRNVLEPELQKLRASVQMLQDSLSSLEHKIDSVSDTLPDRIDSRADTLIQKIDDVTNRLGTQFEEINAARQGRHRELMSLLREFAQLTEHREEIFDDESAETIH